MFRRLLQLNRNFAEKWLNKVRTRYDVSTEGKWKSTTLKPRPDPNPGPNRPSPRPADVPSGGVANPGGYVFMKEERKSADK